MSNQIMIAATLNSLIIAEAKGLLNDPATVLRWQGILARCGNDPLVQTSQLAQKVMGLQPMTEVTADDVRKATEQHPMEQLNAHGVMPVKRDHTWLCRMRHLAFAAQESAQKSQLPLAREQIIELVSILDAHRSELDGAMKAHKPQSDMVSIWAFQDKVVPWTKDSGIRYSTVITLARIRQEWVDRDAPLARWVLLDQSKWLIGWLYYMLGLAASCECPNHVEVVASDPYVPVKVEEVTIEIVCRNCGKANTQNTKAGRPRSRCAHCKHNL